ncbi:universal stress protein [Agrobacterium leguminum]|uniref:universal stress protein n=1 Tax=Agrobacterium leguminum TaxID=2792015 RepID=UPI003CE53DC0
MLTALAKLLKRLENLEAQMVIVCDLKLSSEARQQILSEMLEEHRLIADELMKLGFIVLAGSGIRNDGDLRKTVIAATVFDARSPLVFLAPELKATLRPKKVLLAWNSRPEAARAAKEALPLLVQADAVHIVLVDPDASYYSNGGEPGADVAAFLSRHGVKAVVEQVASADRRIEAVLRQRAREIGCDMIVMGAYGHSRLRERIFGGVTASILEECPIPVFLAR